jgi:tetratricopeptide (TPR) repeat protein
MSKKLTKDQLESDQLVTSYYLAITWIKQHQATVLGGFIAVIAVVGGIIWYITHSSAQEANSRDAIAFAEAKFMQSDYETALYGDDEKMEPGLIEITSRYPRTKAGNLALYYAAVSEVNLGNYESALEFIKSYRPARGVMGVAPISLHGVILMQLERYDDAVRVFERAADWDDNPATTPFNLLRAAEAAHAAGSYSKADELVKRILKDYPDSQQVTDAQRLEGKLAVK